MGAIGEPKREIHIPVTEPATPLPSGSAGTRTRRGAAGCAHPPEPSRDLKRTPVGLPWDVFATPIAARKLARLGMEHDESSSAPPSSGNSARPTASSPTPPARSGARRARRRLQLRVLRGRRRHPALASGRRRARARGARRRARGQGDRARPRVPGERPARASRALPRRVRAVRAAGRDVRVGATSAVWCPPVAGARAGPWSPRRWRTSLGVPVAVQHRRPRRRPGWPPACGSCSRSSPRPWSSCSSPPIVALATGSGIPLACGQLAIVVWLVTVPSLLATARRASRHRRHRSGPAATSLESGRRRGRDRMRHRAHRRGDRVARRDASTSRGLIMMVRFEIDGPVAVVTIDRPDARNAVDRPTADALVDAFTRFEADDELAVAVLTGARRHVLRRRRPEGDGRTRRRARQPGGGRRRRPDGPDPA